LILEEVLEGTKRRHLKKKRLLSDRYGVLEEGWKKKPQERIKRKGRKKLYINFGSEVRVQRL
jgi:hypothetical protein